MQNKYANRGLHLSGTYSSKQLHEHFQNTTMARCFFRYVENRNTQKILLLHIVLSRPKLKTKISLNRKGNNTC